MQITGFRSEPAGLFLDLDQLPGAVALSRDTGDVTLRTEVANGQEGGPAPETIPADKVVDVEAASHEDGHLELKLTVRTDDGSTRVLSLGTTSEAQAARAWIDDVKTVVSFRARRARLNPTIDPNQSRAVPSLTPLPPTEEQVVAASEPALFAPPAPPTDPVEVPSAQMTIDADLEKELEAAMAGQMSAPTSPPAGVGPAPSSVNELPTSEDQLENGMKLKAKVQSVTPDDVFCEVGYRCPGVLPARQFPQGKQPHVGEEFLVIVEKYDTENGVILVNLPRATRKVKGNWDELTVGQIAECVVNKTNKGGLEVTLGTMRAFLPASQVELGFAPALETFVGQKLTVQITEVNPAKRNLVVSRRVILIQERKDAAANFWPKVDVGQQYTGIVKTIKDYGAFVDLGGADGFLHIGEMSWTRVKHPSEVLQEGGQVDVVVLSLDREKQKIGLGMRQLARNPWSDVESRYSNGKTVTGKVTRLADFGAFVELEQGVEGLIHISELDHQRVRMVKDVLAVGQEVQVQVLEVATDRQRISLSLKALKEKPEAPKSAEPEPPPPPVRKRTEPLRGGKTANPGGGLFGNPNDYK
ncbi:MAG: S1 RNA-binding domain-containing protein [Planctomycetota bacterium]